MKRVVKIILILVIFFLYFRGAIFLLDVLSKKKVDKTSMNRVPVVVLSKGKIKLMSYSSLEEYIKEHPDYSFLIPKEEESCLQKQLCDSQPIEVTWTFKVTRLSEDRQYIKVDAFGGHHRDVGYYEATDKYIFPKYIKIYGAPHAVIIFIMSLIVTSLTWSVGSFLFLRRYGLLGS